MEQHECVLCFVLSCSVLLCDERESNVLVYSHRNNPQNTVKQVRQEIIPGVMSWIKKEEIGS